MGWSLLFISLIYLLMLFIIAWWIDRERGQVFFNKNRTLIYVLSLGVYCTAWTFYGSVGRAASNGIDFLAIYLGPCLALPIWLIVVRKIKLLSNNYNLSSLADFLSSRYGKKQSLGTFVTIVLLMGVIPYISLQIKAITESFEYLQQGTTYDPIIPTDLIFTLILGVFTVIYGVKFLEISKPRNGLVAVVAFESLFKLIAILVSGILICWVLFDGPNAIFSLAKASGEYTQIWTIEGESPYANWFWLLLISGLSFIFLPRQFQIAIVDNKSEKDMLSALWSVPLYMLLINLFVIPVALAGLLLYGGTVSSDLYLLGLSNEIGLSLGILVYLGGFSAAISMIIVSSLSLGSMVCNHLIIPGGIRLFPGFSFSLFLLPLRRAAIFGIIFLSYLYYHFFSQKESLVTIGILSFVAVSQLAPIVFGALFWKNANVKGAWMGLFAGFSIWFFALFLPSLLANDHWGHFFQHWVRFIFPDMEIVNSVTFLSLLLNISLFITVSLWTRKGIEETNQAELFVDVDKYSLLDESFIYNTTATYDSLIHLLAKFFGEARTLEILNAYAAENQFDWREQKVVDSKGILYAEKLLTDTIGPASARIMIASVVQDEDISIQEVVNILKESQEVIKLNRQLKSQSEELREISSKLRQANEQLQKMSLIKDEFLYTVTHELRTPITSIRAQAEILLDMDDLTAEEKEHFLSTIVRDCERLTRLITDVLDLEKFESGNQKLHLTLQDITELIREAVQSTQYYIENKNVSIDVDVARDLPKTFLDRDRIIQVLVNLISNAIKFCAQEQGTVLITAYQVDAYIRVNVIDNGAGVAPDLLERIFDKFYQAQNQLRKKPSGTGLGLAICKNIIKHHQGRIFVKNEKEGGARFTFEIPIYRTTKQFISDYERELKKDFNSG